MSNSAAGMSQANADEKGRVIVVILVDAIRRLWSAQLAAQIIGSTDLGRVEGEDSMDARGHNAPAHPRAPDQPPPSAGIECSFDKGRQWMRQPTPHRGIRIASHRVRWLFEPEGRRAGRATRQGDSA
jgi:hypothetical protein